MKELGFEQKSIHYWQWVEAHQDYEIDNGSEDNEISAYLSSELGEMLPGIIRGTFLLNVTKMGDVWEVSYDDDVQAMAVSMHADTMPNAMAKMLIYLRENNLI